jgi:hypothetical protein
VAERVNGILKDKFDLDQVFPTTYAVREVGNRSGTILEMRGGGCNRF